GGGIGWGLLVVAASGAFTDYLRGRLIFAERLERWMPKRAVVGPFGEPDFRDKHRLHPVRTARFGAARRIVKRRLFLNERLQPFVEIGQRLRIESGAHLAGVPQSAVRLVNAEKKRAERFARPFRAGVAADHHLLPLLALGLL